MKVVFLSAVGAIGGAETSLLGLMTGLRRGLPGIELQVIAGEDGPLMDSARALGAETTLAALGPLSRLGDWQFGNMNSGGSGKIRAISGIAAALPRFLQYTARLKRLLAKAQPDIVHSNGMKMHVISALATPRGVPMVWHIHDYVGSRAVMRRLLRVAMLRRPFLVGVSESIVKDVAVSLSCPEGRVACIYNSVDAENFSTHGGSADLDSLAGVAPAPPGTARIGLVGTFARWKGHEVFLSALAAIPREIRFRAYVVGAPVYATPHSQYGVEELKSLCRGLGIADRVAFTGFCRETPEVYRALDIVVHASVAPEPFGMVLVEAMCAGTPVVTTACGGAAELCADSENCLVCAPGDAATMSQAILKLCLEPSLRRRLAAAALAKARRNFSPERAAAAMIRLYLRAIDLRRGGLKIAG
jgi:glycosyltransferase involved in cell wall biosynthesis